MNKKLIGLGIVILIVIGGVWYMKREKDLAELHDIQTDLANYLYNNYQLYTFNKEELEQLDKEYDSGKMTFPEYSKHVDEIAKYSDIQKIEFTGFSVGPMKGLVVNFKINNVYSDDTTLSTISAETGKWLYSFNSGNNRNGYILERKEKSTDKKMSEENIIYNNKGVE
ncbi:hypothetical protein [Enterococcus rivorum]|uniref:Uncharacterized protein n=1 Tax=Enterococcus rivorum TaxID=762845 RepID=A0A1E5KYR0_9ENTE|nr:hypothetical protein [Enterococcus rivorum]MBP2097497.1 hypothetical protein [Enterococcus rivorum]OEH82953.1 hypothetical protein BCR26_01380 [Enterococcus rivorum]